MCQVIGFRHSFCCKTNKKLKKIQLKNFTENYFKLKLVDLVSEGYLINRDTPTSFPQD